MRTAFNIEDGIEQRAELAAHIVLNMAGLGRRGARASELSGPEHPAPGRDFVAELAVAEWKFCTAQRPATVR